MIEKMQELLEIFDRADTLLQTMQNDHDYLRMRLTFGDIQHELERYSKVIQIELHYTEINLLATMKREQ
jgi:hypothetical protein